MNWSPQQDQALMAVHRWLTESDQQVFKLFGYAGTGKTTLAKHFAEGLDSGRAVYGAFTGKAAYVLRSKGCIGATTIHKLIYVPRSQSKAHLLKLQEELRAYQQLPAEQQNPEKIEELKRAINEEGKNCNRPMFTLNMESALKSSSVRLVIIDECSMVDEVIGRDLESFEKKILVLGDPAQLPPVKGTGYFTSSKPDFMLTEIHRQARDNPIIALATQVREGRVPSLGDYGTSRVWGRDKMSPELVMSSDQVIVGTNDTRRRFNERFRQLKNRQTPYPEKDDKVICLRNNHEIGLLNGGIWYVTESSPPEGDQVEMMIRDEVVGPEGTPVSVNAHRKIFAGEPLEWWEKSEAEEFDYGYAITCHKSQGSQWNDVLVFDESSCFRQNKYQWLYTAITRAADRITLMLPV